MNYVDSVENKADKVKRLRLTQADKTNLIKFYRLRYLKLILADIPDKVELVSGGKGQVTTSPSADSEPSNDDDFFTIRFMIENKPYWIAASKVLHLNGEDGQLNSSVSYWRDFPLSLDNSVSPQEKKRNTVCYPSTVSLISLENDGLIAIDDEEAKWAQVTALDEQTLPIQGWVNTEEKVQAHIKVVSPWHWPGFETIEEKASVGELSDKIGKNKVAKLDLDDYTPAMKALHQILTGTLIYSTQRKKNLPPPTFTDRDLKEGLRRSWTAELIGHLLVKYESEWYADEALSKWNEIDDLFEEEKKQQKALIEAGLDELGITELYQRDIAMKKVDEAHEHVKKNWQLEKAQRIKPSLWWQKVAQAQAQNQTTSTEQSNANANTNTPKLSNLSTDGKAWFIHPVAMVDYFQEETKLWYEPLENPQRTLYNSSRNIKPSNGAFGYVRAFWNEELKRLQKKTHNGLDLFADINTPCYACLDGKIVQYKDEGNKGYGNVLAIEVKGDDLRASRNDYTLEFEDEVVNGNGFNLNVDHFYLRYCHLSDKRADLEVGDKVKAGDLIGYTGDTGNAKGVCNPHLHFEIAMKISGNGIGLINRYNPAFFVNLQKIDENLQTNVKERRFKEKK